MVNVHKEMASLSLGSKQQPINNGPILMSIRGVSVCSGERFARPIFNIVRHKFTYINRRSESHQGNCVHYQHLSHCEQHISLYIYNLYI